MSPEEPATAAAETAFAEEYGPGPGRPVCVVIAALDEVTTVGDVVGSVPPVVAGAATECLVVDDGSSDGTGAAARAAGALVCRFAANHGQGVALRSGYRLAAARSARVIVTMDADGQFDPDELPRLVEPVLAGRADMVQGSRRLGRSETTDRVRAAGVVLFGKLVSSLTGAAITDPANGFRAFRPEVPDRVPLRQPQYQTAELLIGALALGFHVVEVPVTVRPRAAGESKKGANWRYGLRFARVVVSTWWSLRTGPVRSQPRR
jgi:glycosyltransferase involved in cell wall biosynthesis